MEKTRGQKILQGIANVVPLVILFYLFDKIAWLYRHCAGITVYDRFAVMIQNFGTAFHSPWPSLFLTDVIIGLIAAAILELVIFARYQHGKKMRAGREYGSAKWGTAKDIAPFVDPVFENNVLLTETERMMLSNRPKDPKYARNKNVIVVGGSGSGKTRFYVKPNLMQMPGGTKNKEGKAEGQVSYVVTDPKGSLIIECGKLLKDVGKYRIKVFNTINFSKSMRYNPFAYIHSETDILKLVNTIIVNTKGEGDKSGEDFWVSATRSQVVESLRTDSNSVLSGELIA